MLNETSADIFKMKLGHLKGGATAQVRLSYVMELPVEGKAHATRLTIPTTIAPRFIPVNDVSLAAKEMGKIGYQSGLDPKVPLSIQIKIIMKGIIESITSPSHHLDVQCDGCLDEKGQCHGIAKLKEDSTDVMNRDLVVLIKSKDSHKPIVFVEKSEDSIAAMVSLIPNFTQKEHKTELIFLVDQSFSMRGKRLDMAKEALKIFLHSLPFNCYFNIVSFGSTFNYLFENASIIYDDHSLQKAKDYVDEMTADYQGTEIYPPLKSIFSQRPIKDHARQILLLTDGDVSNVEELMILVKSYNKISRVFTLGLGSSASRHLVKGVARAGNGISLFSTLNEDLRPKVVSLLKNALSPAMTNVKVLWKGCNDDDDGDDEDEKNLISRTILESINPLSSSSQDEHKSQVLFDGTRMLNFKLFDKDDVPNKVVIVAHSLLGDPLSVTIPITEQDVLRGSRNGNGCGQIIHKMAAKRRIQEISESESESVLLFDKMDFSPSTSRTPPSTKKEITDLGLTFGLATKYTSFIGVDKDSKTLLSEGEMISRHIKHEIPDDMFEAAAATLATDCALKGYEDDGIHLDCISKDHVDGGSGIGGGGTRQGAAPGLNDIIALQRANGSFKMDSILEQLLTKNEQDLKNICPSGTDFIVWITALCCALLEAQFDIDTDSDNDMTSLIIAKAKQYLDSVLPDSKTVEAKAMDIIIFNQMKNLKK